MSNCNKIYQKTKNDIENLRMKRNKLITKIHNLVNTEETNKIEKQTEDIYKSSRSGYLYEVNQNISLTNNFVFFSKLNVLKYDNKEIIIHCYQNLR